MESPNPHPNTCRIRVEPYLAQYARRKFSVDAETGGIRIPCSYNLYHCVWHAMQKWPSVRTWMGLGRRADAPAGNLVIHLPDRRTPEDGLRKNPRYWNYISPRNGRLLAAELKRLFDWDLHHYVDDLAGSMTRKDAVRQFCRYWGLSIDAEDTLLKNLQRRDRRRRLQFLQYP